MRRERRSKAAPKRLASRTSRPPILPVKSRVAWLLAFARRCRGVFGGDVFELVGEDVAEATEVAGAAVDLRLGLVGFGGGAGGGLGFGTVFGSAFGEVAEVLLLLDAQHLFGAEADAPAV